MRDVWVLPTQPFKGSHFAVMPPRIVERCVRIGSAAGDMVLDPFSGSRCTMVVRLV